MKSLRGAVPVSRLLTFSGAVLFFGIAGCDSPVAPGVSQAPAASAVASKASADWGGGNYDGYGYGNGCGDNDDRSCQSRSRVDSDTYHFNSSTIAAGSTIWFTAVANVSGVPHNGGSITASGQVITFTANGTKYSIPVPDATITFSRTATVATTAFNAASNTWVTTVPIGNGNGDRDDDYGCTNGNVFLSGVQFLVPVKLPANINPVTWAAAFTSNTAGMQVNWQWSAAVYTQIPSDYNALGVKPIDDSRNSNYRNSDDAGTPENSRSHTAKGATGNGGSDWTGQNGGSSCADVYVVLPADVVVVAPLQLNGAPATTIVAGKAGTFVATLKNNSSTALPIACTVTIDGTPLAASAITVGNAYNVSVGGTTTCTFTTALAATNNQSTPHTIVVKAIPPSSYTESDPAQSLSTVVTATVAATISADVVVTSIVPQAGSDPLIPQGAVTAGMTDTYIATFQNNTTSGPAQVQCNVAVDGAAAVAIGSPIAVPASGSATCTFTEKLGATTSISAPHSIVVTATPVNFTDNNSSTPQSLTKTIVAGTDVVVSGPTRLIGPSGMLDLTVAANDTAKLGSTDTVQALLTNAGLVATTVTCSATSVGAGGGVLSLLNGILPTTPITIQPGKSVACQFTLTFPQLGPNAITVTATPVAGAPVDLNLTNNSVGVSVSGVASGTFTDIADASLSILQNWSTNAAGALVDRSQQLASIQRLTMLVTQSQAVLGTFSLKGSLVNSAGDTLSSTSTGVKTLAASLSTTAVCQQVVAPYAANFTQVTLSICAEQTDTNPNLQAVWIEYDQAQPAGDVTNPAAKLFALPAAVAANTTKFGFGYDSVTFDVTLNFNINGTNHNDFAHAKVIAFVTAPANQGTDQNGITSFQTGNLQKGRATIIITP